MFISTAICSPNEVFSRISLGTCRDTPIHPPILDRIRIETTARVQSLHTWTALDLTTAVARDFEILFREERNALDLLAIIKSLIQIHSHQTESIFTKSFDGTSHSSRL